jgi:hypothetical protein
MTCDRGQIEKRSAHHGQKSQDAIKKNIHFGLISFGQSRAAGLIVVNDAFPSLQPQINQLSLQVFYVSLSQVLVLAHEGHNLIPVIFTEMLFEPFDNFSASLT